MLEMLLKLRAQVYCKGIWQRFKARGQQIGVQVMKLDGMDIKGKVLRNLY